MIPKKFYSYTFAFFMAFLMSGIMSLTLLSIELKDLIDVILVWPEKWSVSMAIAFPTSLLVVPMIQKMLSKIVAN